MRGLRLSRTTRLQCRYSYDVKYAASLTAHCRAACLGAERLKACWPRPRRRHAAFCDARGAQHGHASGDSRQMAQPTNSASNKGGSEARAPLAASHRLEQHSPIGWSRMPHEGLYARRWPRDVESCSMPSRLLKAARRGSQAHRGTSRARRALEGSNCHGTPSSSGRSRSSWAPRVDERALAC